MPDRLGSLLELSEGKVKGHYAHLHGKLVFIKEHPSGREIHDIQEGTKFGFTGTTGGMTTEQKSVVSSMLKGGAELHHGEAIGADTEAHELAKVHGVNIIRHPPENRRKASDLTGGEVRPPDEYLARNRDIVSESEHLIAAPEGPEASYPRAGEWATVRAARRQGKRITLVYPDGSVQEENPDSTKTATPYSVPSAPADPAKAVPGPADQAGDKPSRAWRSAKVRRSRAEVQPVWDKLEAEIKQLNPGVEFHPGGSWRRGASSIGDLDVVFVTPDGTLNDVKLPPSIRLDRGKGKIAQGDVTTNGVTMHVDLWSATPKERGAFLWFITGPKELNISMRKAALKKGLNLSQIGLLDNGVQVDDGTEKGVAEKLGPEWSKYLDPKSRQQFAGPAPGEKAVEYTVPGSKAGTTYTVTKTGDHYSCTCTGYRFNRKCKHVDAVRTAVAQHPNSTAVDTPLGEIKRVPDSKVPGQPQGKTPPAPSASPAPVRPVTPAPVSASHGIAPGQYHVKGGTRVGKAHMIVAADGTGTYVNSRGETKPLSAVQVARNHASGMSHLPGSSPPAPVAGAPDLSVPQLRQAAPPAPTIQVAPTAPAAQQQLVHDKLPDQSRLPAPVVPAPSSAPNAVRKFLPMQYLEVSVQDLPKYEADDHWWFQQKVDGMRGSLVIEPGKDPWFKAKHGGKLASTTAAKTADPMIVALKKSGAGSPASGPAYIVDGEILNGKFHVFDFVVMGQEKTPWRERMAVAEQWVSTVNAAGVPHPVALPTARTTAEKKALHKATFEDGQEGMVMKRHEAPYTQSNETGSKRVADVLKAKYRTTADVVITARNVGTSSSGVGSKENAEFAVWDEKTGKLVPAGGMDMRGREKKFGPVNVGDVVEVSYLWASKEGMLNQPQLEGIRRDKKKENTSQTQFRFVNKAVLDAAVLKGGDTSAVTGNDVLSATVLGTPVDHLLALAAAGFPERWDGTLECLV